MKTIIFDFDGTISKNGQNIWKQLWKLLKYDTDAIKSEYKLLFKCFINKKITHDQWCKLTCYFFKLKNMNKKIEDFAISRIELKNGCHELFEYLHKRGYELHILSGSIKNMIIKSLQNDVSLFSSINANETIYNDQGKLTYIQETPYDFEGKAFFIKNLIAEKGISPKDILFIGNGDNDEYVSKSGCNTLCINPDGTNPNDTSIWTYYAQIDNMQELVPYIDQIFSDEENFTVN